MAAQDETMMTLSGVGEAKRIHVETVSAAYFPLLRVNAALGRTFTADEDATPQKSPVAVLSDGFWKRRVRRRSADRRPRGAVERPVVHGYRGHAGRLPRAQRSRRRLDSVRDERFRRSPRRARQSRIPGPRAPAARHVGRAPRRRSSTSSRGVSSRRIRSTNEKRGVEVSPLDVELVGQLPSGPACC